MIKRACFLSGRFAAFLLVFGLLSGANFAQAADGSAIWYKLDPAPAGIRAESVPLNFHDLKKTHVGRLTYMGGLELKSSDPRFGGLSGLRVTPDGKYMLALSDNGFWVSAGLAYSGGRLVGVRNGVIAPLLDQNGAFVARHAKADGDSEAFTELPGGGLVVSFEGSNNLWFYGATLTDVMNKKRPRSLPLPMDLYREISDQSVNGGIEALTALSDGSLFAISEESKDQNGNLKAWLVGSDGGATQLAYRQRGGFDPTDMATLPNGDVLVLERHLSLLGGLAARIRLIKEADIRSGKIISGEEIARLQFPYNVDNMEGLAVRQDAAGRTIIYIISDDNYGQLQRTVLLMFRLDKHPLDDDPVQAASLQCKMCQLAIDAMTRADQREDALSSRMR